MNKIKIIILAFFLSAAPSLFADSFYLDRDANGNNDGTSWNDAWVNFQAIDWGTIRPGDIIFISGGSSSKTYANETMYVGSSGTSSAPLTIARAEDPGHDGAVIFDGTLSRNHGISLDGVEYVTLQYITFQNYTGTGAVHIDHATGVKVQNCRFFITGHGGVFLQRSNNCRIRNNIFTTPSNCGAQTDGIYSQLNSDNIYEGNHISISNQDINPHCDGIQMYIDRNITVRNNYIEQDNNKPYNAQGIYATNCYGEILVYNNVVYGPNTENALLTLAIFSEGNARLVAYFNTLVGGGWGTLHLKDAPNSMIKNNIFITNFQNGWLFRLSGQLPAPNSIDHNVYFAPHSQNFTYADGIQSWSGWRGLGFEANGINADPLLRNVAKGDFKPLPISPVIDKGAPLGGFSSDIDGAQRPQGDGYDMGAYEVSLDNLSLSPPQNLKVTVVY